MILLGVEEAVAYAAKRGYDEGYAAGKRDALKWIPVTERLPEDGEEVLCFCSYKGTGAKCECILRYLSCLEEFDELIFYGRKYGGFVDYDSENGYFERSSVTHWMPLPEPPKEEGGRIHELKILPEYFRAVASGEKTFEIRHNDRGYSVGDILVLHEFENGEYTGQVIIRSVCYMVDDPAYCKEGFVVLGLSRE